MRDRLAGVGIGHAPGEDLGRLPAPRSSASIPKRHPSRPRFSGGRTAGDGRSRTACRSRPDAAQGEAALGVGGHRPGPGRKVIDRCPRSKTTPSKLATSPGRALRRIATDRRDRERDVRDGLALQVEQPPVDHLLGPERDVGGGLVGVGVELDPAGTIAGRQGDGAERLVTRRRGPRRIEPEPARAVAARASPIGIGLASRHVGSTPGRHGPRIDHRSSRPAPACPAGRARGRRRTSGPGPASGSRHPASRRSAAAGRRHFLGSSFIARA